MSEGKEKKVEFVSSLLKVKESINQRGSGTIDSILEHKIRFGGVKNFERK